MTDLDEKKHIALHEEQEIAKFRLAIAEEFILIIYRNLSANWWWEGLQIKSTIDKDLAFPNRHMLHQTELSEEYDPIKYPTKPYNLGYLELTRITQGELDLVEVRLVCAWNTVQSFWKELEQVLRREFSVIEDKKEIKNKRVPKSLTVRGKWRRVWYHIRPWREGGMSYEKLNEKLEQDPVFKHLPHDRNTLALIENAAKEGKLEN